MDGQEKSTPIAFEIREYKAKEIILYSGSAFGETIEITDGCAFFESFDNDGVRRILDVCQSGDIFAPNVIPLSELGGFCLMAKTPCRAKISSGGFSFAENPEAERIYFGMQKRLLAHIHILAQHSLRQKIMAYLEYEKDRQGGSVIEMKMSFSDCADYLGADRSAMMRELKKMEADRLVKRSGQKIEILR